MREGHQLVETGLFSNAHNSLSSLFGCNRLLLFGLPKSGRHTESSHICAALTLVSALDTRVMIDLNMPCLFGLQSVFRNLSCLFAVPCLLHVLFKINAILPVTRTALIELRVGGWEL